MHDRGIVRRTVSLKYINPLRFRKPIDLLNHMKANTSLLEHIMRTDPQIEGYHEFQIGYDRKLDLMRQKLAYYDHHALKANGAYLSNKVLHNYFPLFEKMLSPHDRITFKILESAPSISSIIERFLGDAQRKGITRSCEEGAGDFTAYLRSSASVSRSLEPEPNDKIRRIYLDIMKAVTELSRAFHFILAHLIAPYEDKE